MPAISVFAHTAMDTISKRSIERRSNVPMAVKIVVPILSVCGIAIVCLLIYKAMTSDRHSKTERHGLHTQREEQPGRKASAETVEEQLPAYPAGRRDEAPSYEHTGPASGGDASNGPADR